MPFVMFSDSRNYRIGNPALMPEVTGIAEANHLLPFAADLGSWLTSAFVRYTSDVISSYAYPKPDEPDVLVTTFVNGDDSWSYGWDNTVKLEPSKGTQITLSAVVQYIETGISSGSQDLHNSGWTLNGKLNLSHRFPKDWVLQINGEYEGPEPIPQGISQAQYGVDLSLAKDVNKRLNLVATVNDLFDTRRWGNVFDTDEFYQESYRRREQRFARLTVTWKFGEQNSSLFRRRNQQGREPGQEGGGGEGEGF
jgi:outer membrane receptor protein involved in Fe transport